MENVEKLAKELNDKIDGFKSQIDNAVSKEDLEAVKESLTGITSNNEKVNGILDEIQEKVAQIEENGSASNKKNKTFKEEVIERFDEIKKLAKGQLGKDITLKANVLRSSIADNTESVRLDSIGQLGVKRRALYDYFPKFPVGMGNHNGTISYIDWDEATVARAAAMVAEGAAFPESTAAFAEYTIKLQKIGDTLPVSEEFGEDEVLAAAELDNFLRVNVNTLIDQKIATGAGGAADIEGLYTAAPAYTAVASGIADANIKDLVRKMRTAIVKTRGSKYSPNFVAANSDVIDQYILKKDGDNNYMFDMNTGQIAGLDIVEDNNLADNTLVIGDGRFGRIYEMGGVELSEGMVNAQFTSDLKTIKARARLLFLIREVDKTGFLKCTSISAALTTLAT